MTLVKRGNDSVHWYMGELQSRIVASSGIPTDRFHLGKLILQSLKDAPDFISQIDGATGESETNASVLERSIRCATCLRNLGIGHGDVMVLMAPNHIDLTVPLYAALYLGVIIAAVDRTLTLTELQHTFAFSKPKIIFCQSDRAPDVQLTLNNLSLDGQIVSFDSGDYLCSFSDFMENNGDDIAVEDFQAADFDPEDSISFIIATSGTTGLPKAAAVTHKNLAINIPYIWSRSTTFPTPTKIALIGSPLQWLTAILNFVKSPILRIIRLQTSEKLTQEHAYDLINKYRPTYSIFSPTMMSTLLKPDVRDQCDFTCFTSLMLGGSAVPQDLIDELKQVACNAEVNNIYGMSELSGIAFQGDNPAPGSCGKPLGCFQYRIIDVETQTDIFEPNVPGELWLKGPTIFKEYYNNVEATEETFAEDRWFKTGDTFYRDENWNFFFVERIKLLLKYTGYQISPVEIEGVIRQHPGVLDVAVTGIPDALGDLVVACVVPHPDAKPTAQEIKDLVRDTLSDSKQLRGGVIFVDAIPVTASTKVHRRRLKEMALELPRE
ncbi:luciferin 4-monooxygenase-like [Trichoplusia ni]|uniref:Luciferin 4-monooxygenase-like n=1 Tax=Trichoplusia ni TaxID=7111 RepID=A0A7E5VI26_TRINI|nr:luciferin 4-monooxygenase-like [Trichoplusia ni]